MYLKGEVPFVVHAVGTNILLDIVVLVVVDTKTSVAGCLR